MGVAATECARRRDWRGRLRGGADAGVEAPVVDAHAVVRRSDAEVAPERLGELRRLAVSDAAGDLADGQGAVAAAARRRGPCARASGARGTSCRRSRRRRAAAGGARRRRGGRCRRARDRWRTRPRRWRPRPRTAPCGDGWWRGGELARLDYVLARKRMSQLSDSSPNMAHSVCLRRSLQALTRGEEPMHVRDGMSAMVLTVGPGHTLRQVAHLMAERKVGAAVVLDPEAAGRRSSPSATSWTPSAAARTRTRRWSATTSSPTSSSPSRLVARAGRVRDGPPPLPAPRGRRRRRPRRRAVHARHRPLLDEDGATCDIDAAAA